MKMSRNYQDIEACRLALLNEMHAAEAPDLKAEPDLTIRIKNSVRPSYPILVDLAIHAGAICVVIEIFNSIKPLNIDAKVAFFGLELLEVHGDMTVRKSQTSSIAMYTAIDMTNINGKRANMPIF